MKNTTQFFPDLPQKISRLGELIYNLWFSWNADALALLKAMDPKLWEDFDHNPVRVLRELDPQRLADLTIDKEFMALFETVMNQFDAYMADDAHWFASNHANALDTKIAYFSMEFGFHECIRIYSGGLGILAGDHLKTASDLGIPMIGVGLLYRTSYFTQFITRQGEQQAVYRSVDFSSLAMQLVKDDAGKTMTVHVPINGHSVAARVWKVQVGRLPLYLLDTDFPENTEAQRRITERLYVGDRDLRLAQEMILGIGGTRALNAMNITPSVWHMNEGHSALLGFERIRMLMEAGSTYDEAFDKVKASNVFTTHTPVPAGNETFEIDRVNRMMAGYLQTLQIDHSDFLKMGHAGFHADSDPYNLTILALKTSRCANGVSKLHGDVARQMWHSLWPDSSVEDVPIGAITNGVHLNTWMTTQIQQMLTDELGQEWINHVNDRVYWNKIKDIPAKKIWITHMELKRAFLKVMRKRLIIQHERNCESAHTIQAASSLFDPDVLTIGFARRFAPYKRSTLLFKDIERLVSIVNNPEYPVQIVIAGKAHPADATGQALIMQIHEICKRPEFSGRIALVENYDMIFSRRMVSGVDVWLNTPRRPLEASGTSGMKVAMNGGLNLSILDGWWCEGYDPEYGWAIGEEKDYLDSATQDLEDANSLYEIIESSLVPAFYNTDTQGLPIEWIDKMKASMAALIPEFNTDRMLEEYIARVYMPIENGK